MLTIFLCMFEDHFPSACSKETTVKEKQKRNNHYNLNMIMPTLSVSAIWSDLRLHCTALARNIFFASLPCTVLHASFLCFTTWRWKSMLRVLRELLRSSEYERKQRRNGSSCGICDCCALFPTYTAKSSGETLLLIEEEKTKGTATTEAARASILESNQRRVISYQEHGGICSIIWISWSSRIRVTCPSCTKRIQNPFGQIILDNL
jgi:hypothetical protein